MTLTELLASQGLTNALIIDDGYDTQPTASDLANDDDAWTNFFADVGAEREIINTAFPQYEITDASDLKRSDAFVKAVWELKDKIDADLWKGLFGRYLSDEESDREYLNRLEAALGSLNVNIIQSGRTIPANAQSAQLIFADLFLGSSQDDEAMTKSVELLQVLLKGRESNPPIVVLMSRSTRLEDKKEEFRDRAYLIGAMFRVIRKQDLLVPTVLERTLTRLARHYEDASRLAAFIHSWSAGLDAAKTRFMAKIRRIDLPDYCQIQRLLLAFEGQPIGSYLIDIFDRVLQYEIEANTDTINAAENLNNIDSQRYPPPYIAGSVDLQNLVVCSIYQNNERLRVTTTTNADVPVGFGDILGSKLLAAGNALDQQCSEVMLVLTPACDLARGDATRALMLVGKLEELTPLGWKFKGKARTPIFILPGGRRMWIQWNLKDIKALTMADLRLLLGEQGPAQLLSRLRVDQALEIQQSLLSNLSRVGLVAQLPGTFPVEVEIFYLNANDEFSPFDIPSLRATGGVCFTGKDHESNPTVNLVLPEKSCDEILIAIENLDAAAVSQKAKDTFVRLKASKTFPVALEQGLAAPRPDQSSILDISVSHVDDNGNQSAQIVGKICRHPRPDNINNNILKHAALFFVIKEINPPADLP